MEQTANVSTYERGRIKENGFRLTWAEFIELYGEEGTLRFIRGVLFERAATAPALCSEACEAAPGAACVHGCPSLFDALSSPPVYRRC